MGDGENPPPFSFPHDSGIGHPRQFPDRAALGLSTPQEHPSKKSLFFFSITPLQFKPEICYNTLIKSRGRLDNNKDKERATTMNNTNTNNVMRMGFCLCTAMMLFAVIAIVAIA